MTDYRSWRPRFRAMCPEPGPQDLFLVILVNGQRARIRSVEHYDRWRAAAERLADEHQCQVKVLPMTGDELMNFYGIVPGPPQSIEKLKEDDPEFYEQSVRNCMDVLRECGSQDDREQALDLLTKMGALQ